MACSRRHAHIALGVGAYPRSGRSIGPLLRGTHEGTQVQELFESFAVD